MSSRSAVQMRITVPGGSTEPSPLRQLGTRVPAQDYAKLRRKCLSANKLFEDPYFPANDSSLFYTQKLPFTPEWKRPQDIVKDPQLFTGGASRFDVKQGMLGDCWLVAAIASLCQDKKLLNNVIPDASGQGWGSGYAGIFRFRFWHFGEWVDIVVDDRLPTRNGQLIFIHSADTNEFWSALLEKAYAKLYGGYEALKGGKTSEAMVDFTGGIVECYSLDKPDDDLYQTIQRHIKRSSLMSCSITAPTRQEVEAKLDNGLVKGHAYSVTGAEKISVRGKEVRLLRIRNPWGEKEWNGDWSDDDTKMWKSISASQRQTLLEGERPKEDGEFWMSYEDFLKHFTDFEVCSVSVDELYHDEKTKSWNAVIMNGSWEGQRAGGCRNYPTFVNNPQYIIDLQEDSDGDGKCSCLVALMQKDRRKQKKMGVQDLCIGFSIYKAPDGLDSVDKKYVDYNYSSGTSGSFTNAREVLKRFDFDPGRYIIIPCAFKPGEEGDFLLRIFTESLPDDRVEAGEAGETTNPRVAKLKDMFSRLAGADNEIDSEELQDILTASLTKEMTSSVFSIDACRSMISMLDVDKNGTLNFDEFQKLLETIGIWKKTFVKFDKDRSGTLERNEVVHCIRSLGYDLTNNALAILFNRFARRRKFMQIDDFCACLSRVKIMSDTFKRTSGGGSSVQLSKDEFFKITLDA